MTARIIDGKAAAADIRAELRHRVDVLVARGIRPGLTVILVGENPASQVYVRNKAKSSEELGMASELVELPADTSEADLVARIHALNAEPAVHGILVQLPLPATIHTQRVLEAIDPRKDVDGFHYYNVGALVTGHPIFMPCTPYGVMKLLEREEVAIWGQHAVIVGASNIVGKPMAMLLLQKGATVTICNSKTKDLGHHTREADILVVAVGRPRMITGDMIKPGAAVIDVGINRLPDGKLAGDVDFESARKRAGCITPVPGGVGPMTVTMLLVNTVEAAERTCAG